MNYRQIIKLMHLIENDDKFNEYEKDYINTLLSKEAAQPPYQVNKFNDLSFKSNTWHCPTCDGVFEGFMFHCPYCKQTFDWEGLDVRKNIERR